MHPTRCKLAAFLAGLLFCTLSIPAMAQPPNDLSSFVGQWRINISKSVFNRYGPNGNNTPRGAGYSYVFTTQPGGLKLDVYNRFPQPKANRSMIIDADERQHPCTGDCITVGNQGPAGDEQTYAYYEIDPHMLVRLTYVKGKVSEYLSLAVSSDGKTMTHINWNPETPAWNNVYIFEKQQ